MKWTDVVFNNFMVVDVQLGDVCNISIYDVQKAHVGYGSMMRQDAAGPRPAPRKPGDDRRQHE